MMTPSVGFRETAYTQHGTAGEGGTSRELFEASNSLEARFYRSFQVGGERLDRLIHVVEPRVNYWYINPVDQQQLPQFDGVDFVSPQNRVTYSLTNRLLAKLKEADGSLRTREVVSLSLSQSYNLDPEERVFSDLFLNVLTPERIDQAVKGTAQSLGNGFSRVQERRFSNLVAAMRASPLQHLAFQGLVAINTEANRVDGVEAAVRVTVPEYGWVEAGHTFVRDQQTGGLVGRFLLTPLKNVAINYLGRYDTFRDENLEHNVAVTYSTCCWVMGIQYVHRSVTPEGGSDSSIYVLFDLLTGGVPSLPEWGARFIGRR
jgi:lipopolysaccharide assembly outer membrane protein LptD (OstA)